MPQITVDLKKIGTIIGIVVSVCGALWGTAQATIYYHLDERYVQVTDYKASVKEQEIKDLEDKIFELNFKVQNGTATPLEKAQLERYKSRLQKLLGPST